MSDIVFIPRHTQWYEHGTGANRIHVHVRPVSGPNNFLCIVSILLCIYFARYLYMYINTQTLTDKATQDLRQLFFQRKRAVPQMGLEPTLHAFWT